jgi:hypothetical protein
MISYQMKTRRRAWPPPVTAPVVPTVNGCSIASYGRDTRQAHDLGLPRWVSARIIFPSFLCTIPPDACAREARQAQARRMLGAASTRRPGGENCRVTGKYSWHCPNQPLPHPSALCLHGPSLIAFCRARPPSHPWPARTPATMALERQWHWGKVLTSYGLACVGSLTCGECGQPVDLC